MESLVPMISKLAGRETSPRLRLHFNERRTILHVGWRWFDVVRRGDSLASSTAPFQKTIDEITEKRRLPAVVSHRSRTP
jgi:hypothetical protein